MEYEKIYKLFKIFIDDIIKVFPEYKKRLYDLYDDILLEDTVNENNEKINDFLNNIEKYSDQISDKDITFFDSDPILIPNISFKVIWDSDISNNTRENIWKYLQTFCMMKISYESNDKINQMINDIQKKEKIKDKETLEKMKTIKKLNESIQNNKSNDDQPENSNENNSDNDDIVSKIGNILESTNIGKIAKEITEEINIDEMISKDGNIEDMFKGENMMNLFSIINSKIGSKLSSDEINKEDLVGEAGNICNEMQGNDLFNSILSEGFGDLGGLTDLLGAGGGLGGGLGGDLKNINLNSHNNNTNPTRERLQRKLNEKKGINVKKLNK